jgi:poly-gamma-glutamate capsule biosynthesis protein CapA/YwtB (metallophosphatase superfamily)
MYGNILPRHYNGSNRSIRFFLRSLDTLKVNAIRKRFFLLILAGAALAAVVYLLDVHVARAPGEHPFTLAFLGDVMLGRGVAQAHASHERPWALALDGIRPDMEAADLALANLESPLTARPLLQEGYDLRGPAAAAEALSSAGLDLVSLANNHALDAGLGGLSDTQQALQGAQVGWIGPPDPPVLRSLQGQRIAFLAFEDITTPLELTIVEQAVKQARSQAAWVIVAMHWGGEYLPAPDARQQQLAQTLADAGADVVWGQHPHVLQRLEWIQGTGRSRATLVMYSLGNALFDQIEPMDGRRGALLLLRFGGGQIEAIQALPFVIDPRRGQVLAASEVEAARIMERLGPLATEVPRLATISP